MAPTLDTVPSIWRRPARSTFQNDSSTRPPLRQEGSTVLLYYCTIVLLSWQPDGDPVASHENPSHLRRAFRPDLPTRPAPTRALCFNRESLRGRGRIQFSLDNFIASIACIAIACQISRAPKRMTPPHSFCDRPPESPRDVPYHSLVLHNILREPPGQYTSFLIATHDPELLEAVKDPVVVSFSLPSSGSG